MEYQTFGTRVKQTTRKAIRIVGWSALALGIITFCLLYWATFEDGYMAGKILRISDRGMIFKTYEGKINLETFGALRGASPIAESFDFSVEKGNEQLLKDLERAALSGERVNLYYIKRYVRVPWRGETKYFATRVESLEKK